MSYLGQNISYMLGFTTQDKCYINQPTTHDWEANEKQASEQSQKNSLIFLGFEIKKCKPFSLFLFSSSDKELKKMVDLSVRLCPTF